MDHSPARRHPIRATIRLAIFGLGILALLNVPASVPSLGQGKTFGWSVRQRRGGREGTPRLIISRTLRQARAAGLFPGDELLMIDGTSADSATVSEARRRAAVGDTLDLLIRRAHEQRLVRVPVTPASASYSGFLLFVILVAAISWMVGMATITARGEQPAGLLLGAALLFLPPSYFPSGVGGESSLLAAARSAWQLASAAYNLVFPALLLHFIVLHGRWPRKLRSPVLWAAIYGGLAIVLVATAHSLQEPLASATVGLRRHARTAVCIAFGVALLAATLTLFRQRAPLSHSVQWLVPAIAVLAVTGTTQLAAATYAPWWPATEVLSEIDTVAELFLPTLVAVHFFAPFTADGVWNGRRWANSASSMLVTGLYAIALMGVTAVVLHVTGQELAGVEWLLFAAIFAATVAFSPVLRHVRDLVDRRLLTRWIQREHAAQAFVERIASELELDRIASRVAGELPAVLDVRWAELVLVREVVEQWGGGDPALLVTRDATELEAALAGTRPDAPPAPPAPLALSAPVAPVAPIAPVAPVAPIAPVAPVVPFAVPPAPAALGALLAPRPHLPSGHAPGTDREGGAMLLPVHDPRGRLVAVLRVGSRRDDRPFDSAEDGLHRIVVRGIATALSSAESYLRLRSAERELAAAERVASLGALAGGLAHEIKNPLASLQMGLHLLERDGADPAKLQRIRRDARRIDDLVSGLLRATRAGAPPPAEPVDVRAVVRQCVAEVQPLAADREATIAERYPEEPALVWGTAEQVRLVAANLLANALESLPNGGTIAVELRAGRGELVLAVADSGSGIPEALRERIFEWNFSTKPGGTGLGLALARREVERLGGRIEVAANVPVGTVLRVTLPVAPTPAGAATPPSGDHGQLRCARAAEPAPNCLLEPAALHPQLAQPCNDHAS